jgi:hypothetical protein
VPAAVLVDVVDGRGQVWHQLQRDVHAAVLVTRRGRWRQAAARLLLLQPRPRVHLRGGAAATRVCSTCVRSLAVSMLSVLALLPLGPRPADASA